MTTALLFDRDKVDEVDDWESLVDRLGRSSILWIDLPAPSEDEARKIADALGLSPKSQEMLAGTRDGGSLFYDGGSYIHITAHAPHTEDSETDLVGIQCVVSKRWVLTVHEQDIPVIGEFRERAAGSGETGRLDGVEFLAELLAWVLNSYLVAFEDIEAALAEFDVRVMKRGVGDIQDEVRRLVEFRGQVSTLRRALVSHRAMLLALTRPELGPIESSSSAQRFAELQAQLEVGAQAARDTRDSIVGSFDVLIALTENRTNEIVKVLTLASVILLPGAVIAGIFGMNFEVGMFDDANFFWVVIALMGGIAVATLLAAKARKWI